MKKVRNPEASQEQNHDHCTQHAKPAADQNGLEKTHGCHRYCLLEPTSENSFEN